MQRILRAPDGRLMGWMLLALHLSRLPPPGARPHHRRIAATVLDDAASRLGGQLFSLGNGDLALLFRPSDSGSATLSTVTRLFQADLQTVDQLRSLWPLPQSGAEALGYLQTRITDRERPVALPVEPGVQATAIAAMDEVVQTAALSDLMHRQTAVLLRPGKQGQIVPLFREVAISTAVLEARIAAAGQANADPFLFHHLAARLDYRMLGALRRDVPGGGLLSQGLGTAALHVNLTLSGILSASFAEVAAACREAIGGGLVIGVEVPFIEAFADVKAFVLARERLRLAQMRLVLDGMSHQALALTSPAVLEPALVKLNWAPTLPEAGPAVRDAVQRLGPERLVLHRAESEAAIAWGLSVGIQRFQGRYIDSLLAAERLRACAHRAMCGLRPCNERASATGPAGRSGCRNTLLLDLAAPPPAAEALASAA